MTKTYKFKTNKSNNNPINTGSFTDYSKIIDNIILSDIIDKNSYLFGDPTTEYNNHVILNNALKDGDEFAKAAKFLANYKKNYTYIPKKYIYGKMYKLSDGTPIVFYDDEIQIGFDTFSYSDFSDYSFLNNLDTNKKKIIIKIYGNANININLL